MTPKTRKARQADPTLSIRLLGDFRLAYGDKPISSVNSGRLQSLLAYLLLNREAPQSRPHLAFLFWPDSSEDKARNNLRQLLFDLRRALPDAECFLEVDTSMVQWRTNAPFTLDVAELEQAFADACRAERIGDCNAERVSLEKVITLYGGDLLASCYDDWTTTPREHLRQTFVHALEKLIHLLEDSHDYAGAIRCAQQLLQADPLLEETYRQLMRLFARCGDRAGTARVYNTCATVLDRELGVEPSAETRQVYQDLLQAQSVQSPTMRAVLPSTRTHNLRAPLTRFIDREREQAEVKRLVWEQRLVTLIGAAGVGKSRLAHAVANAALESFDGAWWVDLAPVMDPGLIPETVAAALQISERSGQSLLDSICSFFGNNQTLLVLDNCEHLVQACAQLAETLLLSAPRLHILATSREVLGIVGELPWSVPSLAVPPQLGNTIVEEAPVSGILEYDSVRLFVDRAGLTLPTFSLTTANASAIRQICRALDGIPLAIELAAARSKILSPEQIALRLDDRLDLLSSGSRSTLSRHKTLRAALDWSHDLLSKPEQEFFCQLSVFAGGFTLQAAEAICGTVNTDSAADVLDILNLLSHLIDKSLVAVEEREGEMRYHLLETVRQYAWDKLAGSGRSECVRDNHCAFYRQLAEQSESHLRGPSQITWLNRLDLEHENISASIEWSLAHSDIEACMRFASALWYFWTVRGHWTEGRTRLINILSMPISGSFTGLQASGLLGAGYLAFLQGEFETAVRSFHESLELSTGTEYGKQTVDAFYGLGNVEQYRGNLDEASAFFMNGLALSREANDQWRIGCGLLNLGLLRVNAGDNAGARKLFEPSLATFRAVGDQRMIAKSLVNLGLVAYYDNDFSAARPLYAEALELERDLQDKQAIAIVLDNLGYIALHQDDFNKAKRSFKESLKLLREMNAKRSVADILCGLAKVATGQRDPGRAARLFGAAEALLESLGAKVQAMNREEYDAGIAAARSQIRPEEFEAAYSKGREMSFEEAVRYAMT